MEEGREEKGVWEEWQGWQIKGMKGRVEGRWDRKKGRSVEGEGC